MKKTLLFFVFLIINFGGLYLGGILMGSSPGSNTWYNNLQKAPWTPPGYFFGIAWTIDSLFYLLCESVFVTLTKEDGWAFYTSMDFKCSLESCFF